MKKVTGGWEITTKGLHDLYSSPDIIRVHKCRRLRWVEHVARIGKMINSFTVLVENP
jgi:hypothetical protein